MNQYMNLVFFNKLALNYQTGNILPVKLFGIKPMAKS